MRLVNLVSFEDESKEGLHHILSQRESRNHVLRILRWQVITARRASRHDRF